MRFRDRRDAGRHLAEVVRRADLGGGDVVVLGLPRGGVPVAFEIASVLRVPLDVIVVRKLGVPFQPELAMGAIGEGGVRVENRDVLQSAARSSFELEAVETRDALSWNDVPTNIEMGARDSSSGVDARSSSTTGSRRAPRCVPLVRLRGPWERLASSSPCQSHRGRRPRRCPTSATRCCASRRPNRSTPLVSGIATSPRRPTSKWSTSSALRRRETRALRDPRNAHPPVRDEDIRVRTGQVDMCGRLTVPSGPFGTVVFAHGSGSSRHSPRNRYVAGVLNAAGLATLLIDLLSAEEEMERSYVFDIRLLADRLGDATRWTRTVPDVSTTKIGLFGASTGAAAALWAAAQPDSGISAVVSRGGRPDLAAPLLAAVAAPTLLIVGGCDDAVLDLNRRAQEELRCESRLVVVPGATHLFEEPGTLQTVAELARDWFTTELGVTSD